jgi:hypothetical protein
MGHKHVYLEKKFSPMTLFSLVPKFLYKSKNGNLRGKKSLGWGGRGRNLLRFGGFSVGLRHIILS